MSSRAHRASKHKVARLVQWQGQQRRVTRLEEAVECKPAQRIELGRLMGEGVEEEAIP